MWRELKRIWQGQGVMRATMERFGAMLEDCEYIFDHGWDVCLGRAVRDQLDKPVRDRDRCVNDAEREIRRMLVGHLSLNPGEDASGCLALMSMAKDAERLGDHAKKLVSLGGRAADLIAASPHQERFAAIGEAISRDLPRLRRAFLDSDHQSARQLLEAYMPVKRDCQAVLKALLKEEEALAGTIVPQVLVVGHLRRINAHMGNIASGIVFPLDTIDFVELGLRDMDGEPYKA